MMYQNMHHHSHLIFNLVFGRDKGPPLKDTAGQSASPPLDSTTRFTSHRPREQLSASNIIDRLTLIVYLFPS